MSCRFLSFEIGAAARQIGVCRRLQPRAIRLYSIGVAFGSSLKFVMRDTHIAPDDAANRPPNRTENPDQKRPLVLLAEANHRHFLELKELLELYNVAVLEARDGETAIDLTVRECPDLILLNARLARLDGYEAARLIRSIKSFDRTPIVFFSDETARAVRRRALAVGADSFHIAPLDFERLDWIMEKFLPAAN